MRFLNSKERRAFFGRLEETYGYHGPTDYVVYEGGRDKYYIISRDLEKLPFEELRIAQGGLHVASDAHGELRLTMDGAQLFGPSCDKPFAKLDTAGRDEWIAGQDVDSEGEDGWVIVGWEKDILGCGRRKDGRIINYVPKERRISEPHP